jgi:arginase family enzyme
MSGLRIVGLDVDHGLRHKPRLRDACEGTIDLTGRTRALRLFCRRTAAAPALRAIREARERWPGPWLSVAGSGDFHHLSLMLLETLPSSTGPFTLVLIDNHPDWFRLPPRYHCGNWVAGALALPSVRGAALIGLDSNDFRKRDMAVCPLDDLASGRLTVVPWNVEEAFAPGRWPRAAAQTGSPVARRLFGSRASFSPISKTGPAAAFERATARLEGQSVYLSIDKDCLHARDAATDWEQGRLSLDDLRQGVALLCERCRVIGADIFGDKAPSPLQGRLKRLDAGRAGPWRPPTEAEHALNEDASLELMSVIAGRHVPAGARK